jgi:ADP-ribose pyrophosphatase
MTKRIVEHLEKIGDEYAWLEIVEADFADGRGPRRAQLLGAPDAAFTVAIEKNKVALVKQNRFTGFGESYELPGGVIDKGETPEACARRELREEAGLKALSIERLGVSQPHAPFKALHHLYVTTSFEHVGQQLEASESEMTVHWFDLPTVLEMIEKEEIIDSKTIVAILLAKEKCYFTSTS